MSLPSSWICWILQQCVVDTIMGENRLPSREFLVQIAGRETGGVDFGLHGGHHVTKLVVFLLQHICLSELPSGLEELRMKTLDFVFLNL